jgi:hypothetical protein
MVDIMWVLTFLVINIIAGTDKAVPTLTNTATINIFKFPLGYLNDVLNTAGAPGIFDLAGGGFTEVYTLINSMFTPNTAQSLHLVPAAAANTQGNGCQWWQNIQSWFNLAATGGVGLVIPGATPCVNQTIQDIAKESVNDLLIQVAGWFLSWIIGGLAFLVIVIAIFITMFRIWFMLLRAYIHIILEVILAPFYIAAGLIPGSSIGFGSWFRSMAANLLAFPVTIAMFVLARVLIDAFFPNGANPNITTAATAAGGSLFIPPLIGNPNGTGTMSPLGAFIALGFIFAIPEILNTLRTALQAPGIGLGAAAFGSFGAGGRLLRGTSSSATAGFIEPTTGKFTGGFRIGRLLSRI